MALIPNPNMQTNTALSVGELNRQIKSILEHHWLSVNVTGEVSNAALPRSGHCYFSLKDDTASIRCVLFKGQSKTLPSNGQAITIQGQVSFYSARGDCQIIIHHWQPKGEGDLQAELKERFKRCQDRGFFSESIKKNLPRFPEHIAIITAAQSAAYQDVLKVHQKRFPHTKLSLFPCLVQGFNAPDELIKSLKKADQCGADALLICRGGGSLEDLWCFNDEKLVETIAHLLTPCITGIGHEVDTTLADWAADANEATPTAAMERLLPDQHDLKQTLDHHQKQLTTFILHFIKQQEWKLKQYISSLSIKHLSPLTWKLSQLNDTLLSQMIRFTTTMRNNHQTLRYQLHAAQPCFHQASSLLSLMSHQLDDGCLKILEHKQQTLNHLVTKLSTISPQACFERGYALIAQKQLITSVHHVQQEQDIYLELKDGQIIVKHYQIKYQ
ncbi:MAG: exodeoxyribonuclease VII large subunit [Candidatus Comchoanobacterales bacterium]